MDIEFKLTTLRQEYPLKITRLQFNESFLKSNADFPKGFFVDLGTNK